MDKQTKLIMEHQNKSEKKDENNQKSQNLYVQFTYMKYNHLCLLWNDRHIKDEILDRLYDHDSEQYSQKKLL